MDFFFSFEYGNEMIEKVNHNHNKVMICRKPLMKTRTHQKFINI